MKNSSRAHASCVEGVCVRPETHELSEHAVASDTPDEWSQQVSTLRLTKKLHHCLWALHGANEVCKP
eukprot:5231261-Amphidinium_carterae.1